MNIARIVSITADGTYNGTHGLLYQFWVRFDDNTEGQANAKSQVPPYKVGDDVGYEITGAFPKGNKLKIDRKAAQAPAQAPAGGGSSWDQAKPVTQIRPPAGRPAQSAQSAQPPVRSAQSMGPAVHGATVGMAVNNAVAIILHNASATDGPAAVVDLNTLQHHVEGIAALLISASMRLESGQVKIESPGEEVSY